MDAHDQPFTCGATWRVKHGLLPWRGRWVVAVFLSLVAPNAFAYLDPGTGSIILQGLIAAIAAIVTYFGLYWQKVRAFFQRFRKKGEQRDDASSPSDKHPD